MGHCVEQIIDRCGKDSQGWKAASVHKAGGPTKSTAPRHVPLPCSQLLPTDAVTLQEAFPWMTGMTAPGTEAVTSPPLEPACTCESSSPSCTHMFLKMEALMLPQVLLEIQVCHKSREQPRQVWTKAVWHVLILIFMRT